MQIPLDHHDGQGHEDEYQGKYQQRRPPVPIVLVGFDHLKPSDRREPPQPMLVIHIGNKSAHQTKQVAPGAMPVGPHVPTRRPPRQEWPRRPKEADTHERYAPIDQTSLQG